MKYFWADSQEKILIRIITNRNSSNISVRLLYNASIIYAIKKDNKENILIYNTKHRYTNTRTEHNNFKYFINIIKNDIKTINKYAFYNINTILKNEQFDEMLFVYKLYKLLLINNMLTDKIKFMLLKKYDIEDYMNYLNGDVTDKDYFFPEI